MRSYYPCLYLFSIDREVPLRYPTGLVSVLTFVGHSKRLRRLIGQAAMWSLLVVVPTPLYDHHLGRPQVAEPLHIQAFVTEPPIEALAVRILLRTARFDVRRLNLLLLQPPLYGSRDTFWPIIHMREADIESCMQVEQE